MKEILNEMKSCLDELLDAHNRFDKALWTANHDGMMIAQKHIETARVKCALASRLFDEVMNNAATEGA